MRHGLSVSAPEALRLRFRAGCREVIEHPDVPRHYKHIGIQEWRARRGQRGEPPRRAVAQGDFVALPQQHRLA